MTTRSALVKKNRPKRTPSRKPPKPVPQAAALGSKRRFPIVGIGASAGGLEAYQRFFSHLPAETGMGFVLVQHLAPRPPSLLSQIIARSTSMPVTEATDGGVVLPNHVYVIPSNQNLEIRGGKLRLIPRLETGRPNLSIDHFLKSLSEDRGSDSIGVILSGTGSDGAEGLRVLKAEGGITFAQSPESAKYDGMPVRAIAVDHVDFILSPEEIAAELGKISRHPFLRSPVRRAKSREVELDASGDLYSEIFSLIKQSTGVDFSEYKQPTVHRRIGRRMVLHKLTNMPAYAKLLRGDAKERKALHDDILINVTSFFRDPQMFETLKKETFGELLSHRSSQDPLRIWVAGCSTGEEVYSIAICLLEALEKRGLAIPVQIFATDLSENCIEFARTARYPDAIRERVSPERLSRFFTESDGMFRVNKSVRDLCVFAKHDVTRDAPFSRMDLISCRNLLIYLQSSLQKQVISTFSYALKPAGFLFLGTSDSTGLIKPFFSPVGGKSSIYRGKPGTRRIHTAPFTSPRGAASNRFRPPAPATLALDDELDRELDRVLASEHAPSSVTINESGEIVRFRGDTSSFLSNPSGRASLSIYKIAREGLALELRGAVESARKKNALVSRKGLQVKSGSGLLAVEVVVQPLKTRAETRWFLVLFKENRGDSHRSGTSAKSIKPSSAQSVRVRELTRELKSTRQYLETLNRDLEMANQELQSANEEVLSSNEELQSTNEEIETAKEELQSTNEELATVNDELQSRNTDLDRLSNDLVNLIGSVEIPIIMIGKDGRIRRFTSKFEKMLNLIGSDIGRPLSDIRSNFESLKLDVDLGEMVNLCITTVQSKDTEVQDKNGHWYRLQIKPYRTSDGQPDGAVVALIDIHALKESVTALQIAKNDAEQAKGAAEAGNRAKDVFLATLSHELRTPLTTILTFAQMIRLGKLDEGKARRGIELIEQSALAQAQLINDLLDVSRIIMGKLTLELQIVDPAEIVRTAIDSVAPLATAKGIEIKFEHPSNGALIAADPVRFKQVCWNLLTNAIKFSSEQGEIHVELETVSTARGESLELRIIDFGKGIPAAFLPRLFDRFSQADGSSTRVHGGMGLGLAIVRNLIEMMKGSVRAESKGPGHGTTFTVRLPVHSILRQKGDELMLPATPSTSLRHGSFEDAAGMTLKGLRILLVDDDPGARESLGLMLTTFGAEVREMSSAAEAFAALTEFVPDALVSDLAMPVEDGYSLVSRIRRHGSSEVKRVPAIALTAFGGGEDRKRAFAAGYDRYLSKPVDALQLVRHIIELLERRPVPLLEE